MSRNSSSIVPVPSSSSIVPVPSSSSIDASLDILRRRALRDHIRVYFEAACTAVARIVTARRHEMLCWREHVCSRDVCFPACEQDCIARGLLDPPVVSRDVYVCCHRVVHICTAADTEMQELSFIRHVFSRRRGRGIFRDLSGALLRVRNCVRALQAGGGSGRCCMISGREFATPDLAAYSTLEYGTHFANSLTGRGTTRAAMDTPTTLVRTVYVNPVEYAPNATFANDPLLPIHPVQHARPVARRTTNYTNRCGHIAARAQRWIKDLHNLWAALLREMDSPRAQTARIAAQAKARRTAMEHYVMQRRRRRQQITVVRTAEAALVAEAAVCGAAQRARQVLTAPGGAICFPSSDAMFRITNAISQVWLRISLDTGKERMPQDTRFCIAVLYMMRDGNSPMRGAHPLLAHEPALLNAIPPLVVLQQHQRAEYRLCNDGKQTIALIVSQQMVAASTAGRVL